MNPSNQELFLKAHTCYANQDYSQALQLYQKISAKTAHTWYNMGNCAYKSDKYLDALVYWKRAEKYGDAKVKQASTRNMQRVVEKFPNQRHKYSTALAISPALVQILFFFTFSVFLVSNRWLWRTKKFFLMGVLSVAMVAAGTMSYIAYLHAQSAYAVIMNDEAPVYAGPNNGYHQIATVAQGSTVKVLGDKQNWKKIMWDSHTGWIQNDNIEVI